MMATRTFTSNRGRDRLTISTICNHFIAFHEAGFEFQKERRRRIRLVYWNPFTWFGGFEWVKSDAGAGVTILEFIFIQGQDIRRNPADFAVSNTSNVGYFKSSCIYSGLAVGSGDIPIDGSTNLGNDARSINDVIIRFTYNGTTRTLRHTEG